MKISIIIPAYNEEKYLASTLASLVVARDRVGGDAEIIVVDNESTDRTAEIASSFSIRLINESVHNIGRVRNTGAAAANGDVLIFIDADTTVPAELFERVKGIM